MDFFSSVPRRKLFSLLWRDEKRLRMAGKICLSFLLLRYKSARSAFKPAEFKTGLNCCSWDMRFHRQSPSCSSPSPGAKQGEESPQQLCGSQRSPEQGSWSGAGLSKLWYAYHWWDTNHFQMADEGSSSTPVWSCLCVFPHRYWKSSHASVSPNSCLEPLPGSVEVPTQALKSFLLRGDHLRQLSGHPFAGFPGALHRLFIFPCCLNCIRFLILP